MIYNLAHMAWTQFWQLTVLIAIVVVTVRLAARSRPYLAHVLWLVVLAKCLTPPVIPSSGGVFCWLQPPRSSTSVVKTSPAELALFDSISESEQSRFALLADSIKKADGLAEREPRNAAPSTAADSACGLRIGQVTTAEITPQAESSTGISAQSWRLVLFWAGAVWLAGSILLAVVAVIRLASCLRGIRQNIAECPLELTALVKDLEKRLALRRPVRLIVSASRVGPAVLGWLRPTIVLPAVVIRGKSPRELEPILAHELLHVRRGDLWTGMWQVLAQAVWWFHPLVWLANRRVTRAAEACCDEAVIAELGCDSEHYAQSLLAVLEQKQQLITLPAFPGIRPVDVTRERLERIMQLGQGCRTHTPWWCWLVMISAAGIVLPGAALVGTAEEQSAEPSTERRASPDATVADRDVRTALRKEDVTSTGNHQSAVNREVVTVRVANDLRALRLGDAIDLLLIDVARIQKSNSDPRVVFEQGDPAAEPPTFDEIMRALPGHAEGTSPFLAEVSRKNARITVELTASHLDDSRFYPMIGPARLRREHFKCTVRSDKTVRSDWPIPFTHTDNIVEVVYVDKAQLVSADSPQGKDFRRALTTETVTVDSVPARGGDQDSHEIRVAVTTDQARRLNAAIATGRLMIFLNAADAGQVSNLSAPSNPRSTDTNIEAAAKENVDSNRTISIILHINAKTGKVDQVLLLNADEIQTQTRNSVKRIEFTLEENDTRVGSPQSGSQKLKTNATHDKTTAGTDSSLKNRRKYKKEASSSSNELVTSTYSVADLVVAVEHMSIAMAEDGSLTDSKGGTTAPASADPQASFTELIELIQATIAPDTWESQSGPGTVMPYRTTLSLFIRQTPAVHEQIAELLGQLRRLQDLQCVFQVDVISTSGRDPKAPLKLETQSDAPDDGAMYLTESQVTAFRDLVAQMANEETAAVTGGFKLVLFNGQGAELKLRRRRLPTKGTAPLPTLSIAPIIAADRSAIRLQLAVGASKPLDALARTQGYTIKKGQSLLLDMTDAHLRNNLARMVGAQSGAVRRLHKLDLFAGGEPGAAGQPDKAALAERVLLLITPRIVEIVEQEELPGVDLPTGKPLSAIVVEGNKTIETKAIMDLVKTQTGRPLDPKQVKEDVRALVAKRWFADVEAQVAESDDGPVLIFRVTERREEPRQPQTGSESR